MNKSKYFVNGIWLTKDQYDELQTLETFEDIADFWKQAKPVKTKNMDNVLDQLMNDQNLMNKLTKLGGE